MARYLTILDGPTAATARPVVSISDPATVAAVQELVGAYLTGQYAPRAADGGRIVALPARGERRRKQLSAN